MRDKDLKKAEKQAQILLTLAKKVENYRRDLFTPEEQKQFSEEVLALKTSGTREEIEAAMEKLSGTLETLGGSIFPQKMLPEWVELIVVAAILAGGIRAFFFQPFKIPTNSMFPTYNGMTSQVYSAPISEPIKWAERIFKSASFYEFKAEVDGEIAVSFGQRPARNPGKGIFQSDEDVFEIMIGEKIQKLPLPRDFSLDSTLIERFFPEEFAKKNHSNPEKIANILKKVRAGELKCNRLPGKVFIQTGIFAKKDEPFLKFKIFGGDMVLVNRFAYHFKKPKAGDPFVFRTHNIDGLGNQELYYIKRLAGTPGDTLQITDEGKLLRNGVPATGIRAFDKNNARDFQENYFGYFPRAGGEIPYSGRNKDFRLWLDKPKTVPANAYYALGDNSSNSADSRVWGYVPARDTVGKALFILYPFSPRWGIAE